MRFLKRLKGPTFHHQSFVTADARLNAYDYSFLIPTGIAGLTGITPDHNYFYARPPTDFAVFIQEAKAPNAAPAGQPNPLITPALALSFIQNLSGR